MLGNFWIIKGLLADEAIQFAQLLKYSYGFILFFLKTFAHLAANIAEALGSFGYHARAVALHDADLFGTKT